MPAVRMARVTAATALEVRRGVIRCRLVPHSGLEARISLERYTAEPRSFERSEGSGGGGKAKAPHVACQRTLLRARSVRPPSWHAAHAQAHVCAGTGASPDHRQQPW